MTANPPAGAAQQTDALEAGLARAFELDDQSFRLGDRRRYAGKAQSNWELL